MGQRSQVVIFWEYPDKHPCDARGIFKQSENSIYADRIMRNLQWNFGAAMIRRAHHAVTQWERIRSNITRPQTMSDGDVAALLAMFCFDPANGDVQGLSSLDEQSDYRLDAVWNNNGAFLIHIDADLQLTFAFVIGPEDGGDLRTVATAREYMDAWYATSTATRAKEPPELTAQIDVLDAMGAYMSQETANMVMDTVTVTTPVGAPF